MSSSQHPNYSRAVVRERMQRALAAARQSEAGLDGRAYWRQLHTAAAELVQVYRLLWDNEDRWLLDQAGILKWDWVAGLLLDIADGYDQEAPADPGRSEHVATLVQEVLRELDEFDEIPDA